MSELLVLSKPRKKIVSLDLALRQRPECHPEGGIRFAHSLELIDGGARIELAHCGEFAVQHGRDTLEHVVGWKSSSELYIRGERRRNLDASGEFPQRQLFFISSPADECSQRFHVPKHIAKTLPG